MKTYKRPESVLVVVYTAAGDCLLLRRTEPADFWQSVTGSLEWGETAREAAARELFEETGFPAGNLRDENLSFEFPIIEPWKRRYAPDVTTNHEKVFSIRLSHPVPPTLNPEEHLDYRWLPRAEAMERVSSWTNRRAIEQIVPG